MIGAVLTSSASQNVLSETWEMSTIMPNLFISLTISLPSGVSPVVRPSRSPEEPAQLLVFECVSVM